MPKPIALRYIPPAENAVVCQRCGCAEFSIVATGNQDELRLTCCGCRSNYALELVPDGGSTEDKAVCVLPDVVVKNLLEAATLQLAVITAAGDGPMTGQFRDRAAAKAKSAIEAAHKALGYGHDR